MTIWPAFERLLFIRDTLELSIQIQRAQFRLEQSFPVPKGMLRSALESRQCLFSFPDSRETRKDAAAVQHKQTLL